MALAKDNHQKPSRSFYGNMLENGSLVQFPHISPTISSSSSANSSNNGLINFKPGFGSESFIDSSNVSLLNYQNENNNNNPINHNNYPIWEGNCGSMNNCTSNMRLLEEVSNLRSSFSDYNQDSIGNNEWIYTKPNVVDPPQESTTQSTCFKRSINLEEENMQAPKKHCTSSAPKKPSKKSTSTLKDPQSAAAKNRRERISERLKILQDLVPNGSKVDLVTMLEKAIGYVKFLQLQVKVLATDEFWPAAGGKAPDISQVREAIDAILSSQRSSQGTTSCTTQIDNYNIRK